MGVAGDRYLLVHQPHHAGIADIIPAKLGRAVAQGGRAYEVEQRLRSLHEVVALPHHEVKTLLGERQEIEPGRPRDRPRRDPAIDAAGADRLGDVGSGRKGGFCQLQIVERDAGARQ